MISSETVEIKINKPLTKKQIEIELKNKFDNIVKWSVVGVFENILKILIASEKKAL